MNAHSTAVGMDVRLQLFHLQANHVRIRERLTRLLRKRHEAMAAQLVCQRRLYEGRAAMEQQLQVLQVKYGRRWIKEAKRQKDEAALNGRWIEGARKWKSEAAMNWDKSSESLGLKEIKESAESSESAEFHSCE